MNMIIFLVLTLLTTTTIVIAFPSPSEPRPSDETLGGIVHLGRAADKAQLKNEGRLAADLEYPCPKDQKLLSLLQIDSNEFSNIVGISNDDSEVVARLKERNPATYSAASSSGSRFALLRSTTIIRVNTGSGDPTKHKLRNNDGC